MASSTAANLWVLLGLGIVGVLLAAKRLKRPARPDNGAFISRLELLPPPQPPPPQARHPLTGLCFAIADAVHYEGTLAENGQVFDTSHEDNSVFSFKIGEGTVIKAWDIAVKTMKVGEVAKITCKPEYAYGAAGSPPEIPPDATLIFEVELVACRPRKGSSVESVSEEKTRLEELRRQRETVAGAKEEKKRKREETKATAAARVQAKLEAKKGKGKKAK